jgi:hypothetical protein
MSSYARKSSSVKPAARIADGRVVLDAGAHQVEVCLQRHLGSVRDALGLAEQRDEVVRGDARRRVVQGSTFVGDLEGPATERLDDVEHQRIASHREPRVLAKATGADFGRWERDERVQRRAPHVRTEDVETERARQVRDDRALVGLDGVGHVGDGHVGRGDDEEVDTVRGTRRVVAAVDGISDNPSALGERQRQRATGATWPDDSKRRHATSLPWRTARAPVEPARMGEWWRSRRRPFPASVHASTSRLRQGSPWACSAVRVGGVMWSSTTRRILTPSP